MTDEKKQFPLNTIADLIGAHIDDQAASLLVTGVAPIEYAASGEITFLSNKRYIRYLTNTEASAIILPEDFSGECRPVALKVSNPYEAFASVLVLFDPRRPNDIADGIHPTAVVGENVELGKNVSLGAHVVIGDNVKIGAGTRIGAGTVIMSESQIGEECLIYPNVTLMDRTLIGNRVLLHSGVVLGSDGFGFAPVDGKYQKIPQIGNVIIEDDVEIGAGTTVDRAVMGSTKIKRGSKIDNLVQVAHNDIIGEDTVIAAQAGFSGSLKVGNGCRIGGQAGFVGHIEIGDKASVGAQAGVTGNVKEGTVVSGYPARPHHESMRSLAALRKLPELMKRVTALENALKSFLNTSK